ncbi:MAG: EFR1 family ferrodoxin, partial [Candidatus Thorarchaeota archaeon]
NLFFYILLLTLVILMNIGIFYFSATGITELIANHIASILKREEHSVTQKNIITPDSRKSEFNFLEFDAYFFGFPVFGGRAPSVAEEWIRTLDGKNQKCSMFFTYGARDLEWAHQATFYLLTKANFKVVLSAEFIGRHSFNVSERFSIAEGRPNKGDLEIATNFAKESISRFQKDSKFNIDISDFTYIPREIEESEGLLAFAYPSREEGYCSMCYLCEEECPVNAFNPIIGKTNRKLCIKCMHCVTICPDRVIHIGDITEIYKYFIDELGLTADVVQRKMSKIIY